MPDPNYVSEIEREDGTLLTIKDAEARVAIAADEDALIELVDSGAKNLSEWAGGTTETDDSFVVQNEPITLKQGTYVISFDTTADSGSCEVVFYDENDNVGSHTFDNISSSKLSSEITLTADAIKFNLFTTKAATITNFMICTKAAWGISHEYQTYRPSYQELYEQTETNENTISSILDGTTIDSFGDVETALSNKQNTIDSSHKLSAELVDNSTPVFATATQGGKADTAIQGIKVNSSTVNPDSNKVINITVPTSAADVSALPDTTKYATALSLTINSSTFVVTAQLKDQNGDNLGTAQTIDLPLESVVVGGSYDGQTKKVVLTLQNGNTVEFSVADLVSGLQTELSTSNKLNPTFIEYDSTHRAVSDTEKSTWNNKQNALSSTQLDAVNSGINSTKVAQIETNISYLQELLSGMTVSRLIDFENDNTDVLVGDLTRLKCYSKMGRCNLNDAGEVTAWQGDENYTETGFMSDGTPVQTMVYVPKFYYRVEPLKLTAIGTGGLGGYHLKKAIISISDFPMPGYKLHPAFENEKGNAIDCFYIGAFESCTFKTATGVYRIDDAQDVVWTSVTGDKLASIGCSTAGDLTTGAKPTSGLSDVNAHRVNFETIATNRGPGWHSCLLKQTAAIQMLMLVEAGIKTQSSTIAVPNSQNNFGKGVVGITDDGSHNCASLTGSTVGNSTGNAAQTYNEINGTKTAYTEDGKVSVNYHGIENFYGNIWKFIWGLNIWGDGTMRGGAPYVCKDFNFAEGVIAGNYEDAGFTAINPSGGSSYISAFGYGKEEYDWLLIGSDTTNAGENKVIGDYNYISYNLNGYRIARWGGGWNAGATAGAFDWDLANGVGFRFRLISSR